MTLSGCNLILIQEIPTSDFGDRPHSSSNFLFFCGITPLVSFPSFVGWCCLCYCAGYFLFLTFLSVTETVNQLLSAVTCKFANVWSFEPQDSFILNNISESPTYIKECPSKLQQKRKIKVEGVIAQYVSQAEQSSHFPQSGPRWCLGGSAAGKVRQPLRRDSIGIHKYS
jgi:hypothetical protein